MNRKLQRYALISEIVGALAVVMSLIYVGVGVRQNTEALQVANHQRLVAMEVEKNAWLRNPDFAAAYVLAFDGFDKLSPVQKTQYEMFIADTLTAWEFAFITHEKDALEDDIWDGWDRYYRSEVEAEPFRRFWRKYGFTFSPAFKSYVDSVLKDAEPPSQDR